MNYKVLGYSLLLPGIWSSVLFLKILGVFSIVLDHMSIAGGVGLFIGSMAAPFILRRKFLYKHTLDQEQLSLLYFNFLGKPEQLDIPLSRIIELKFVRKNRLVSDFPRFKVLQKNSKLTFQIWEKSMVNEIVELVETKGQRVD